MRRDFIADLLPLLLLLTNSWVIQGFVENEPLPNGSVTEVNLKDLPANEVFQQTISLAPISNIAFSITNIPSNISFIIFQIHTYQYNVTLSYEKGNLNKVSNTSVFGSNIGLFIDTSLKQSTQMFLKNDNVHVVNAVLVVTAYNNKAPIPGGCNMEFNTEVAPYEKLRERDSVVIVDFQPASVSRHDAFQPPCERNSVQHEMYRMYLPEQDFSLETYFSAMSKMLSVEDIIRNGEKISSPLASSSMRRVFSAYVGIGSVYAAVATHGNYSSAYVPVFSYACSPLLYPETCKLLNDWFSKMLCAVTFFLGFFSVFMGHRHLKSDMALPVFVTATVIGYTIAVGFSVSSPHSNANIAIAITVGAVVVLSSMLLNTNLIFNLTSGFFFASVMYFHAPDAFLTVGNDWLFWVAFAAVVLLGSLISSALNSAVVLLTCAIFGSYMMILPIDYYAGSTLKYIIINVIRRATVSDFQTAIVQAPFQIVDICLTILWICLAIIRIVKQLSPNMLSFPDTYVVTERTPLVNSRFIGRVNIRA